MEAEKIATIVKEQLMFLNPVMIGLFGSFARNDMKSDSDIDILVKFSTSPSLLKLIAVENRLSQLIGRKVDLVTYGSLKNERIKFSVNRDIKIIYQT